MLTTNHTLAVTICRIRSVVSMHRVRHIFEANAGIKSALQCVLAQYRRAA